MNVGMLWLDDDRKRTLEEKVRRAADYYFQKYGRLPELCLVNSTMSAGEAKVGGIEIKPAKTVLPYHFWLGMKA